MAVNRAALVDANLREALGALQGVEQRAAEPASRVSAESRLSRAQLVELLHTQLTSRALDIVARELRAQNEGFYTIGSSGHEGNALVAMYTAPTDMSFLHYRSGAFMLQRARQLPGETPIRDICLSLVASSDDPVSGGRHKVWGSRRLCVPPQTSTIASHLPKAVGAAFAFDRSRGLAGRALPEGLAADSIFVCSFGDASLNHSTAQGAINAASWAAFQSLPVPVLFVCEDNGLGISVRSPSGWVAASMSRCPGISYRQADGVDVLAGSDAVAAAVAECRERRRPVFLHLKVVRLLGHAGSDVELGYRREAQLVADEARDPVRRTACLAVEHGVMSAAEVLELYDETLARVRGAAAEAVGHPKHTTVSSISAPLALELDGVTAARCVAEPAARRELWADRLPEAGPPRHLARLLNTALHDLLLADQDLLVFGQDVARKGGVYTVTTDLTARFGVGRVFNTLLDEQTILGTAIGAAHVGFLPIPEIQYLAYLHNALDQLRGEACSLKFFSDGQWENPMVVRIAAFGYQKGFGGHFHNDNSIAALRDIPGLIIAAPSTGADAVRMLRGAVALARARGAVVAFLEPIALYMAKDLHEPGDGLWLDAYPEPAGMLLPGEPSLLGPEDADLLIVTYGNGHYLSRQALPEIEAAGYSVRVLDLRWLLPLPEAAIVAAAGRAGRVLIVDEGRRTGSVSETVFTLLSERVGGDARRWRRVVGVDTFIPLGRAWPHVMPSRDGIATAALSLLREEL